MVSKPDLRVTNGYIIGVSQRSVCSGVVCTEILSHLSLWLLEAHQSVALFNGRATLECCQNPREAVAVLHRLTFILKVKAGLIPYFSYCQENLFKTNVFVCKSVLYNFPTLPVSLSPRFIHSY